MTCKGTLRIEERQKQMELDAERWNALINSPYIHLYGFAGDIGKEIVHCGMDFTAKIRDSDKDSVHVKEPTELARQVLITYVDTVIKLNKGEKILLDNIPNR